MTYELKVVFFSMLTPGLTYANSQGAKFSKMDLAQLYTYPIFTINTKLQHLNKKWYPGGIKMVNTVVLLPNPR